MEDFNREFKGIWIPREIWLDDNLTLFEKALYAEIDSLDGENHCYASNEYFAEFCQASISSVTRAISKLISFGYVDVVSFDGRQRVLTTTKESDGLSSIVNLTRQDDRIDEAESSKNENLLYREKNKENNKEAPEPAPSKKSNPRRNFGTNKLTDDLESGKEIKEQTARKKKKTKFDQCLDEIEKSKYGFNTDVKEILKEHLTMSFYSKDPKRITSRSNYFSKLDRLATLIKQGYSGVDIVQQSIDRKWNGFYEPNTKKNYEGNNNLPSIPDYEIDTRTREERQADYDSRKWEF